MALLLKLAESRFDLFITSDQKIAYQQNLSGRQIAILQLSTNKLRPIMAAAPLFQSVVAAMKRRPLNSSCCRSREFSIFSTAAICSRFHCWKLLEKVVHAVTRFQIMKQRFYRDACSVKTCCPMHYLGFARHNLVHSNTIKL